PTRPIDRADWPRRMNLRLRAEFIAGAEEDSRPQLGRGLAKAELDRVLRRYPGECRRSKPYSCCVALTSKPHGIGAQDSDPRTFQSRCQIEGNAPQAPHF